MGEVEDGHFTIYIFLVPSRWGELTGPQDGNVSVSYVLNPRVSRHALSLLLRGQKWHSHLSMC